MFVFRMFKKCQEKWKSIKKEIREKILETRADFRSISVENENFRGEIEAKFEQNVANSDRTEFLPMGLFRLVDLVLHLNIISLSITVRVVSLASLLSIDGLSLGHRSKSS